MAASIPAASIDALVSVDPRVLDAGELKQHLVELAAARSKLAAAEAAAVAEFDHRGCCVEDGMVNVRSWLAHHTGVPRAVAGGRVLLAKRLRRMPAMTDALASGLVTEAHARAMARCITPRTVAAFERDESLLVTKAKELEADDFDLLVTRWLLLNDENGPDPGSERPSKLHVSSMLAGRVRLDGELDFEDAAEFRAELDSIADELWHQDHAVGAGDQQQDRSPAQRNAAALVEMARRSSAAGDRDRDDSDDAASPAPTGRPRRPHLVVVADLEAIAGAATGIAELDDGTPVAQSILQRWLCDSSIGRVVMAARSVPVDLGRITYTASAGQRRALIARDRGCIVPGCKRKPRWCDAHHVVPYPNGPTNLANLVLLCKRHHRHVHAGIIKLLPDDRLGWIVSRPDGTPLRQRPPPHLAA
jgi:Domain of unknown function (DUF222)